MRSPAGVCHAISRESMNIFRYISYSFPGYPAYFITQISMDPPTALAQAPRGNNNSPRRKRRDARQDRQPIRPRIRGISSWHQKSEYETQRKLHDVIIVLWECLDWSEYDNTGVAHSLWELLLQILQSTTVVVLARSSTPTWLSLVSPRNRTSSHVSPIPLQRHRARFLHGRRASAPSRRHYRCTFFALTRRATFQTSGRIYDKLEP